MKLDTYSAGDFHRGRPRWVEALWIVVAGLSFSTWLPGSAWRRTLLRVFGATIGSGVIIKPRVRIKFPWKLAIGDHSWIGEEVWIDNLDQVSIGSHCCISQGAYFCTGNHRWDRASFDLATKPILVEDQCWIAAKVCLAPGTIVRARAVLAMGLAASGEYSEAEIHRYHSTVSSESRRES